MLSQLSNKRDVVQPWVLLKLFLLILAVERSEGWDVMSAHTYSHLFSVIQPYLLGRDPHQHVNNLIVASSDSCKPCGMNRIHPLFTVRVISALTVRCWQMSDRGQGYLGIVVITTRQMCTLALGPLGIKWLWVCLSASIWCGDAASRCGDMKGRVDEKHTASFFLSVSHGVYRTGCSRR